MRLKKLLTVLPILLFSGLIGLFLWKIYFVYNKAGYIVDWHGWWITSHQVEGDVLYFRKEFNLPNNIKNAWLFVSASDRFDVYLNGEKTGGEVLDGWFPLATYDVTEKIRLGINTLGIRVAKRGFEGPVKAVLELGYEDINGNTHYFTSDETWRVSNREDRGAPLGRNWYDNGFNDAGWTNAEILGRPRGLWLNLDPRIYTFTASGRWFWAGNEREISCQAEIKVPKKPQTAWIRLASRGGFKLIVNKNLIDVQQYILGTENETTSIPSMQQTGENLKVYQIGPFLNHNNTILINGYAEGTNRGLYVDSIIEGGGWSKRIDETDFKCFYPGGSASLQIYKGDAGWNSLRIKQIIDEIYIPLNLDIYLYFILIIIFLVSSVVFIGLTYAFSNGTRLPFYFLSGAYIIPSLFLIFIYIVRYDTRFYESFPFQVKFLILSLCLLVLFWFFSPLINKIKIKYSPAWLPTMIFILIFLVGAFLRFKNISQESLHGDEAGLLLKALTIFSHGFPSIKVVPEVPARYVLTSELLSYVQALSFIIFGASEFSLRLPMVLFGILTMPLLYCFGKMIGGERVGLLASAIFSLLPSAIGMTHFARYPSQLAFFGFLTGFLAFLYLRTDRVICLYLCSLSFLLTYFTWEGSALMVPALFLSCIIMGKNKKKLLKGAIVFLLIIVPPVAIQLFFRFYQVRFEGNYLLGPSIAGLSPRLMFLTPFYEPFYYISNFFFIENHQFLSILFFAGIPLVFFKFKTYRSLLFVYVFPLIVPFIMTNFLEVANYRYAYYLLPYLVLSACVVFFVFLDYLGKNKENSSLNFINSAFASVMLVVISSGLFLNLKHFPDITSAVKTDLNLRYFAEAEKGIDFIKPYIEPGDIILAYQPHLVGYYLDRTDFLGHYLLKNVDKPGRVDYFLETKLALPVITFLRNSSFIAVHRSTGTPAILSLNELKRIIGANKRAWFIFPEGEKFLDDDTTEFIENNKSKVVFEAYGIQIYLIGGT